MGGGSLSKESFVTELIGPEGAVLTGGLVWLQRINTITNGPEYIKEQSGGLFPSNRRRSIMCAHVVQNDERMSSSHRNSFFHKELILCAFTLKKRLNFCVFFILATSAVRGPVRRLA